jgi:hypothetical protein
MGFLILTYERTSKSYENGGEASLCEIATGDETWAHHSEPKTKQLN